MLKLPGAGGRAERATDYPLNFWPGWGGEIWALNPPGYGGSPRPATLQTLVDAARAAFAEVERHAAGRPILVAGSSLGGAAALAVAAECRVAGLLLRNPPPLREVIRGRFGRRGLRWAVDLLARQVPEALGALDNARRCQAPAAFILSGRDRTVPPQYQRQIIEHYAGEKRVLEVPEADHHTPLGPEDHVQHQALLDWLRTRLAAGPPP